MERNEQTTTAVAEEQEVITKMLGAHVPQELYWEFKKAAASRGEQLKAAVEHAARIYIDLSKGGK